MSRDKSVVATNNWALPDVKLTSGALEAVKYSAAACMLMDHINKYLLGESSDLMFALGRLSMPFFIFVLTYHLAQPVGMRARAKRLMRKLLVFAVISTPIYSSLGNVVFGWWPLNILFTLFALTLLIYFASQTTPTSRFLSWAVFFIGGLLVEFWWPALAIGLSSWMYFKTPTKRLLLSSFIAVASLIIINHNAWALMVLPVFFGFSQWRLSVPRLPWFFYIFYPAHLGLIYLIIHYHEIS